MFSSDSINSPLQRVIRFGRWVMPVTLSALGIGYTVWESILSDGYSPTSLQALAGFILLGIVGPLLTFLALTWPERAPPITLFRGGLGRAIECALFGFWRWHDGRRGCRPGA